MGGDERPLIARAVNGEEGAYRGIGASAGA